MHLHTRRTFAGSSARLKHDVFRQQFPVPVAQVSDQYQVIIAVGFNSGDRGSELSSELIGAYAEPRNLLTAIVDPLVAAVDVRFGNLSNLRSVGKQAKHACLRRPPPSLFLLDYSGSTT